MCETNYRTIGDALYRLYAEALGNWADAVLQHKDVSSDLDDQINYACLKERQSALWDACKLVAEIATHDQAEGSTDNVK